MTFYESDSTYFETKQCLCATRKLKNTDMFVYHNDVHMSQDTPEANQKFIQLSKAYETLKDPVLRKQYDDHGEEGLNINNKKGTYHSWTYYANNFGIYDDDRSLG